MNKCNWCNLSDDEKKWLLIKTEHWSVYLADKQDYIGRCILLLNRHCGCLSELTESEQISLKPIIEKLETCFKVVLRAEMCNWSCLLNDFYKSEEPNPHLHLHVRPRFKSPFILNRVHYVDQEFGHYYNSQKENILGSHERILLYNRLKNALNE